MHYQIIVGFWLWAVNNLEFALKVIEFINYDGVPYEILQWFTSSRGQKVKYLAKNIKNKLELQVMKQVPK